MEVLILVILVVVSAAVIALPLQTWHTSGNDQPGAGDGYDAALTALIAGVNTARTRYYGTADPSSGASPAWGATELGVNWVESDNAIGGGGDDLGSVVKVWSILDSTPTYGWLTRAARGYVALEPNMNALNLASQSDVPATDLDLNAETDDRAVAALLQVEVLDTGTPAATVYAALRKNGTTTDARERRVYPQAASVPNMIQILVELDSSQVCEYIIEASGAGTFDLRVDVLGYYIRAE